MSQVRWFAEIRPRWEAYSHFGLQLNRIDPTEPYRVACLTRRGPGEPDPQFDPMVTMAIPLPPPEDPMELDAWERNGPAEPAIGAAYLDGVFEAPEA